MASDLCIIYNPRSGRGQAAKRLQRLLMQWKGRATFLPTERPGHAEQLAFGAALDGVSMVAAAGGDGTVHEVANGLLRAARPDVVFAVVPIGSSNDYAQSLQHANRPAVWSVDVGRVSDPTGRERYFVCCLGAGLNGNVTLESREIKRLQGLALYGLATVRALWYRYATPVLTVRFDDGPRETLPTLMMSVLLARGEGSFVMAPDAELDDGLFDYVHAGGLSRWQAFRLLPRLAIAGPPRDNPQIRLGRCARIAVQSPSPLTVHIDGEFFARPEDNIREMEIAIRPKALRVRLGLPEF